MDTTNLKYQINDGNISKKYFTVKYKIERDVFYLKNQNNNSGINATFLCNFYWSIQTMEKLTRQEIYSASQD